MTPTRRLLTTRPALFLLTLCLGLTAGPGCESQPDSADRPKRSFNTSGLPIQPGEAAKLDRAIAWATPIVLDGRQRLHDVAWLGNLVVAIERPNNLVTAIDANTGQVRWEIALGSDLEDLFNATRLDDLIMVNSEARVFTIDARNGQLLNTADLAGPVRSGHLISGGLLIFGSIDGVVFAHDARSKVVQWRYALPSSISRTPVATDLSVFAVDDGGTYAMLDLADGEVQWRESAFGPVNARPALGLGDVLVASEDQSLYSLGRATGRATWIYRSQKPLNTRPFTASRIVLQLDPDKGWVGLDAFTGEQRWVQNDQSLSPATLLDTRVLALGRDGLVMLDGQTGTVGLEVQTAPLMSAIAGPERSLLLVAKDGRIVRLNPF